MTAPPEAGRTPRGRLAAAAPIALVLLAAGPAAFARESRSDPAGKKAELVIGIREFFSDVPAMIADSDGWYAREGAEVRTIVKPQGKDSGPLLLDGTLDLAILGNHWTVEALSKARKDDPLVVIACLGGGGRRWRVMASERSGITSLDGLQNKKLGAWPSSYGYQIFERLLRGKGIKPELVTIPMDPELAAATMAKGTVDALLAWEPIPSMLEDRKLAREIFTLDGLGDGVPVYLVARKESVRRHPAAVGAVLRALDRAASFVREKPESAAARVSARLRTPRRVLEKALRAHEFQVGLTCRQREALREAVRTFRESGINRVPADLEIEFDPEPLRAVQRERAAGPSMPFEDPCAS